MTTVQPRTANQPPPLEGYDLYGENRPLVEAVAREGADWADTALRELGTLLGGEPLELGRLANEHPPRLRTHDRFGNRIDEVEFHPAWHELLGLAVSCGLHASPWREPRPGAHVARAAAFLTLAEVEAGVGCPLSMTFAAVPALRAEPALVDEWAPLLTSTVYDPGLRPAADKAGALCGMAMTERQGGSDVRANETVARPVGDGEATLHGHKWFCSAPMCDAFLVLAQAPGGLTCYLLPRVLPDGERNAFHIDRLKDKLGNRSNASAEIRLEGAWARRVGEEGRGVATIIEMVVHTRLDCVLGSTGLDAARGRGGDASRGAPLGVRAPARRAAADGERARRPVHRLRGRDGARAPARARVRRGRRAVSPARDDGREVLGLQGDAAARGGGARVHRRQRLRRGERAAAPVSREPAELGVGGTGERAGARRPPCAAAAARERRRGAARDRARARGWTRGSTRRSAALRAELADRGGVAGARRLVERLALCLAGSLLLRHGDAAVAEAFCATRLGGDGGRSYGTLPRGVDAAAIVERHRPRT